MFFPEKSKISMAFKSSKARRWLGVEGEWRYTAVADMESLSESPEKLPPPRARIARFYKSGRVVLGFLAFLVVTCGIIAVGLAIKYCSGAFEVARSTGLQPDQFRPSRACKNPSVRHEWRHLSEGEQWEYIRAVKCLMSRPSKARDNGTLYDDFPWIHATVGAFCMDPYVIHPPSVIIETS